MDESGIRTSIKINATVALCDAQQLDRFGAQAKACR